MSSVCACICPKSMKSMSCGATAPRPMAGHKNFRFLEVTEFFVLHFLLLLCVFFGSLLGVIASSVPLRFHTLSALQVCIVQSVLANEKRVDAVTCYTLMQLAPIVTSAIPSNSSAALVSFVATFSCLFICILTCAVACCPHPRLKLMK